MKHLPLTLIKCPSGKYMFVGSVPVVLCDWAGGKDYRPKVFDTLEQARALATKEGYITKEA